MSRNQKIKPWPKVNENRGPNGGRLCKCGCDREVRPPRRYWFSQECIDKTALECDYRTMKKHVYKRDRGRCQLCGNHPRKIRKFVHGLWLKCRFDRQEYDDIIQKYKLAGWPDLDRAWHEFDHIIEVCDGGWDRVDNLRVLCLPCHKRKTQKAREARKCLTYQTNLRTA